MRRVIVIGAALLFIAAAQRERPLPNTQTFLREVRSRLQTDGQRQYGYKYVETRRRVTLDSAGRQTGVSVTVIESEPGLPGEERWERIVARDGTRVPAEDLRKQDEERRRRENEYRLKLARRTPADQAKQEREWDKQRRELAETISDIFRVYDIVMRGRESI